MSEEHPSLSIRARVFQLLNENPLLSAKRICQLLQIPYHKEKTYIWKLRSEWKTLPLNEQRSICSLPSSVHGWRGWCYIPKLDRALALERGWIESHARNHWLLWKDKIGRLQWFSTGRVNLYVRKPANIGRASQLMANGFYASGLVTDFKIFELIVQGLKFKGAHYVFEVNQRLPRFTIDLFNKSNGLTLKVGDRSHPNGLELLVHYPDWAERNEGLFQNLTGVLSQLLQLNSPLNSPLKEPPKRLDYIG